MKATWKLTRAERDEVAARYASGESSTTLGIEYGLDPSSVTELARRCGYRVRTNSEAHRVYSLNESAFDVWTPDAAYWAGFLFADGTTAVNRRTVTLGLAESDGAAVVAFRTFLGSDRPIRLVDQSKSSFQNCESAARLTVTSERIVSRLLAAGRRNDNQSVACPELATSLHFWRGMVDGDGSIGVYRRKPNCPAMRTRLELVGGRQLLQQFADFLNPVVAPCRVRVLRHKGIWVVVTSGPAAAKSLAVLYPPGCTALARKDAAARAAMAFEAGKAAAILRVATENAARRCSTPGCDRPYCTVGLCRPCYQRAVAGPKRRAKRQGR